ncbi:MAG: gephyrin-like molybdotransferase Glp [bacterium]
MITMEEAEKILHEWPLQTKEEEIELSDCSGRVLSRDVLSSVDMPPFDRSAMDGYALLSSDKSERFKILETLAAGDIPEMPIHPGECSRIMTGAMLPPGADRVVKREVTAEEDGFMRLTGEDPNDNIRRLGEDLCKGSVMIRKGNRIRPQEAALLASAGLKRIYVCKKPVVGILTTGSELVEPGESLRSGQIYNSNATSIAAQIQGMGAESRPLGTVPDKEEAIRSAIESLLPACDLLILSGGVSAGDYDFVPGVLRSLGVALHFEKVAVQPGMPTVFGTRGKKCFFGLPGNPVSTFVIFEIFIKPFLFRMMGHEWPPLLIRATLGETCRRKNAERAAFIPVIYREGKASLLPYHGAAHLLALSRANALMQVPRGVLEISAGSAVDVRPI